eukprot:182229_1
MITRTLTTMIVPVIVSVFLLNECGNYWTKLWRPCADDKQSFNIEYLLFPSSIWVNYTSAPNTTTQDYVGFERTKLQILSDASVCSANNIKWNKCIRLFLYYWCNLLMIKMIIMICMPIFIIMENNQT